LLADDKPRQAQAMPHRSGSGVLLLIEQPLLTGFSTDTLPTVPAIADKTDAIPRDF